MTNLDSVLKSRDIALSTKICLVKAMVFPVHVWMWELDHKEGWVLKNWCFWIVVLEKTLESPLNCKLNQSILKEINPEYSLEYSCWSWNSNTLATWHEKLTYSKRSWCRERLKTKREECGRGRDDSITNPIDMNLSKLLEIVKDREAWCTAAHGVTKSWTQISDWTTITTQIFK